MRRTASLRLILLTVVPLLLLAMLLLAAVATPGPQKKPPSFPLSLFAKAMPDDYIDERSCARCHRESAASMARSPHAGYVQNPHLSIDLQGCQSCHGPGRPHITHLALSSNPYAYVI